MDAPRVFRFGNLRFPNSAKLRSIGVYASGALYSIGFWFFMDAVIFSKTVNALTVHVTFVDWIPAICLLLGMLVVNSVEKLRLLNDTLALSSFGGAGHAVWQARVVLFLGFALLAGGVAGSFVVLILKFLMKHYTYPTLGMGVANVVCNSCIMASTAILWAVQSVEDEYLYLLSL